MNAPTNPYTPPAVEEPAAEQRDFPWYVAARGIHVQDRAVLPEIDLITGEEGGHLVPVSHAVNITKGKTPRFLSIILLVMVGAIVAIDLPLAWSITCAVGAAGIASLAFRKSHPRVTFTFFSIGTGKPAAPGKVIFRVAEILFFFTALACLALLQINEWSWIGTFVFLFLSQRMAKRREKITTRGLEIREAGGVTGWVRIGGAHPAALAKLDEIQKHRGSLEPEFPEA
ncbi:MAG: hypothetical protein KF712_19985 [Akkermansiaceae bacterium]|nr:hypothetical protein [Akkermansiaceae bacterium]